jgi:hypothetical protein
MVFGRPSHQQDRVRHNESPKSFRENNLLEDRNDWLRSSLGLHGARDIENIFDG